MNDEFQEIVRNFCKNLFALAKINKPNIRSIVLQYKNGNIYVGRNQGGKYDATYYNHGDIGEIANIVTSNEFQNLIKQIFDMIIIKLSENKERKSNIKNFNIFYTTGTHKINICRSKIGSKGIDRSRIFPEF